MDMPSRVAMHPWLHRIPTERTASTGNWGGIWALRTPGGRWVGVDYMCVMIGSYPIRKFYIYRGSCNLSIVVRCVNVDVVVCIPHFYWGRDSCGIARNMGSMVTNYLARAKVSLRMMHCSQLG